VCVLEKVSAHEIRKGKGREGDEQLCYQYLTGLSEFLKDHRLFFFSCTRGSQVSTSIPLSSGSSLSIAKTGQKA